MIERSVLVSITAKDITQFRRAARAINSYAAGDPAGGINSWEVEELKKLASYIFLRAETMNALYKRDVMGWGE